ncbi:MAG: hypothetical protein AB8B72_14760 [Crocinitomicaceae bacterium]
MSKILKNYNVLVLCIVGSFVRFLYGYFFEPWNQAPDQLAWELILEQRNFRYDHFIHYPHEGGTFLISILAHFVELFTSLSSLTIVAFLIDFVVRLIQILVVKRIFDTKVASLFGLWTVFATPAIIPWGSVNFGLHSIASVFPFLLLFLLFLKKNTVKFHFACGIFLGLAFWFSYANMILVPVFFLYRLINRQSIKKWIFSVLGLATILIIHLLVRQFFDAGFRLNELSIGSVRGVDFSLSDVNLFDRLSDIPKVVANSTLALPDTNVFMPLLRLIYYVFFFLAAFSFIGLYRKNSFYKGIFMIIPIVVFFLLIYTFSPFYEIRDKGSYVIFRHLAYIIPVISLFIVVGLSSLKYKFLVVLFLVFGMVRPIQLFNSEKLSGSDDVIKAAGWIIGTKLGHDKNIIEDIVMSNPKDKEILTQGAGWGISAALLFDSKNMDKLEIDLKITELVELISEYPKPLQKNLFTGIKFSFKKNLSPRLNPELLPRIVQKFNRIE